MEISCPNCNSKYNIDSNKLSGTSGKIRCPRCKQVFQPDLSTMEGEFTFETEEGQNTLNPKGEPLGMSQILDGIDTWTVNPIDTCPVGPDITDSMTETFKQKPDDDKSSIKPPITSSDIFDAVRFLNHMFIDAVEKKVSSIHFKCASNSVELLFRIENLLYCVDEISKIDYREVNQKLKKISGLPAMAIDAPQLNGRIRFDYYNKQSVYYTLATMPTFLGENMVITRTISGLGRFNNEYFGLSNENIEQITRTIYDGIGMIVVCGNHKYIKNELLIYIGGLAQMRGASACCIDPYEILPSTTHIPKIKLSTENDFGLTAALNSLQNQDIDLLIVPEIDGHGEDGLHLMIASLMSCQVLTTMRGPDFVSGLMRLTSMNVSVLNLIIGLKLIITLHTFPRICPDCKEIDKEFESQYSNILHQDKVRAYRGKGCSKCQNSGYRGFTNICVVLEDCNDIRSKLQINKEFYEIRESLETLSSEQIYVAGIEKCNKGEITVQDLYRKLPFNLERDENKIK